jgi:hypothetical protein
MGKMLRSLSTGKSHFPCHCCYDPYSIEARAIEKRSWQAEIAEATEERIIKLLEAELTCDECEMNGFENDIPNKAVALIKGENK